MSKKRRNRQSAPAVPAPLKTVWQSGGQYLMAVLFFFVVCLCSASTVKVTVLLLIIGALVAVVAGFSRLRERITVPLLALALLVLMDGISTLYALSGKFALYEFLKVLGAFCLVLLFLALTPGEGAAPGCRIATVLEGGAALAGLVSIDLLSTRIISGAALGLLGTVTPDFTGLGAVEEGIRMNGIYGNPNVLAGCVGIGVLLSLGLVLSAEGNRERAVHVCCLFVNALSFVLAFSMGASGSIAVAFVACLILEKKERRGSLFVLMVETLLLTVAAAAVISVTSFQVWSGFQPVPLLCVVAGAAGLVLLDRFAGRRLGERLKEHSRAVLALIGGVVVLLAVFAVLAFRLTGGISLEAGESLRRAAYPEPGTYTLTAQADGPVQVTIETQNQQDTMMHTSTVLYRGDLSGAEFTVPEDSMVVYFHFSARSAVRLETVEYAGSGGSGALPLDYKLLPGFIANRMQGLFANQNAIQRLVFFADGMKLFQRSPVVGLGLGAFENGIKGVQSFYYETKYAHNHYIQSLVETGAIGLFLFVAVLVLSGVSVVLARRKEDAHPLTAALGAALVFMAVHGATEVVFSAYAYLPLAFGVFALISLCCSQALPLPALKKPVKTGALSGVAALVAVFGVLLGCNLRAQSILTHNPTFSTVAQAVNLDKFEWADYMLSYVNSSINADVSDDIRRQADEYAARLERVDSNTIPIYLARYYFSQGREADGLRMVEKYVNYVASDADAWQEAFDLLLAYLSDTEVYRNGVLRIAQMLDDWNAQNMGSIELDEVSRAVIEELRTKA